MSLQSAVRSLIAYLYYFVSLWVQRGHCISLQNGRSLIKFPMQHILTYLLVRCSIFYRHFVFFHLFPLFIAYLSNIFDTIFQVNFHTIYYFFAVESTAKNSTKNPYKCNCEIINLIQRVTSESSGGVKWIILECGNKWIFQTFCHFVSNLIDRRVQFNRIKSIAPILYLYRPPFLSLGNLLLLFYSAP